MLATFAPAVLPTSLRSLLAHAGHGAGEPDSLLHYFTEPVHGTGWLLLAGCALAALAIVVRRVRAVRRRG